MPSQIPRWQSGLAFMGIAAKHECGAMLDCLALADKAVSAAAGDPTKGDLILATPLAAALAMRSPARWSLGVAGWKEDVRGAADVAAAFDPASRAGTAYYTHGLGIAHGVYLADSQVVRQTADVLAGAEHSGDDMALNLSRTAHAVALLHCDNPDWQRSAELLAQVRNEALSDRYSFTAISLVDSEIARIEVHLGRFDDAVERARAIANDLLNCGGSFYTALACSALVEALIARGGEANLDQAQSIVHRLAAVPTVEGFVLNKITLLRLRAMLARAAGDSNYGELVARYRAMANELASKRTSPGPTRCRPSDCAFSYTPAACCVRNRTLAAACSRSRHLARGLGFHLPIQFAVVR